MITSVIHKQHDLQQLRMGILSTGITPDIIVIFSGVLYTLQIQTS